MTPLRLLKTAIVPALTELEAYGIKDTRAARIMMLAIALQETKLLARRQIVAGGVENGPAMSFWQFERLGGCVAVLSHRSTALTMAAMCQAYNVKADATPLWEAMRYQDVLAAIATRLNLYTSPLAIPTTQQEGWDMYVRVWAPGKPHPATWPSAWDVATATVDGHV